jgi:hypothetical protein
MLKAFMIKASKSVVRNANQQPDAVCVGSGDSVAFDSKLVDSERIAFSADRLDSLKGFKEEALCEKGDEHPGSGRNVIAQNGVRLRWPGFDGHL